MNWTHNYLILSIITWPLPHPVRRRSDLPLRASPRSHALLSGAREWPVRVLCHVHNNKYQKSTIDIIYAASRKITTEGAGRERVSLGK